jgi:hypothetical protein
MSLQHQRMPRTGRELREVMAHPLGARVNKLALTDNEFGRLLLQAYQFAGTACVDHHPERSSLMLAIALESAVLGRDTQSELSYQLGVRVAHLIGKGLNGRRLVAKTITDLYARRSAIVHTGQYGVSRKELSLMFFYCKAALAILAMAPSFSEFTKNQQLEDWFRDRILDGREY